MKNQINTALQAVCRQGLLDGVSSAVVAGVSFRQERGRLHACFAGGRTRMDGAGMPVDEGTVFDLASLTKPLCTALLTVSLVGRNRLQLDDTLAKVLDVSLPEDKKSLKIDQLLSHSAGLLPYRPYYREFGTELRKEGTCQMLERVVAEPLVYPPGSECRYSDLGYMLLGQLVEHLTGRSLSACLRQQITERLGLATDLFFLPVDHPLPVEKNRIAATEDCPWRGRVLQGEVHDEHCWLMGGVAGHAGLFGTLRGVMGLCEWVLDLWQGRTDHPDLPVELLRTALTRQLANHTWCLGFDTPTPGSSSSGRYFSAQSVGHLGFSGTSFWIDPEKDAVVVLLTNRIHPSRGNQRLRRFRPLFHDRVMASVQAGGAEVFGG